MKSIQGYWIVGVVSKKGWYKMFALGSLNGPNDWI